MDVHSHRAIYVLPCRRSGPPPLLTLSQCGFRRLTPSPDLHAGLTEEPADVWQQTVTVELVALGGVLVLLVRAALRVKAHFHERHYQPVEEKSQGQVELAHDVRIQLSDPRESELAYLVDAKLIREERYDLIEDRARQYMDAIANARA